MYGDFGDFVAMLLWLALVWTVALIVYAVSMARKLRQARPSATLSPSRASTLVGKVVAAASEIPSPVLGEPPCVLWSAVDPPRVGYRRSRPFAVESLDCGVVWIDVGRHVWLGEGYRKERIGPDARLWYREQCRRADEENEGASEWYDPSSDVALLRDAQRVEGETRDAETREQLDASTVSLRSHTLNVRTLRVGDEVVVRGRFELADIDVEGYRGTPAVARHYRLRPGQGWGGAIVIHFCDRRTLRPTPGQVVRWSGVLLAISVLPAFMCWGILDMAMGLNIVRLIGLETN